MILLDLLKKKRERERERDRERERAIKAICIPEAKQHLLNIM